MIERLSGTPTQKCNLLKSSIFDNTHSMNSSRSAESPPPPFPPTFIHFSTSTSHRACVWVLLLLQHTGSRGGGGGVGCGGETTVGSAAPFMLNVFFTHTGNYPSHTHATVHPLTHSHTHMHAQEHLCNACRAIHTYDGLCICSHTHTDMKRTGTLIQILCIASYKYEHMDGSPFHHESACTLCSLMRPRSFCETFSTSCLPILFRSIFCLLSVSKCGV